MSDNCHQTLHQALSRNFEQKPMQPEPTTKGFVLSPNHSTTRLVTRESPTIKEPPEATFKTALFLSERQGEGGLRTQGYFKHSLPDKPLITVITVVLNDEKHLEETILSVINQTYDNVEYIIIDGGSNDRTLDIIRKYEHAVDYWVSEKDEGIYDAMNKGSTVCSGDALIFINSGDQLLLEGFSKIVENYGKISKNIRKTVILYGQNNWIGNISPGFRYLPHILPFLGRLPSHQAMLIPRNIQLKIPFNLKFKISADQDFKIKAYRTGIKFIEFKNIISTSLPEGVSQRIPNHSILINRAKETYLIMKENYNPIWALIYSFIFYTWNSRKLGKK